MKTLIVLAFICASVCAYGATTTSHAVRPPHKISKLFKSSKVKKVKVRGHDRAWTVKKVHYRKGFDYYSYANRPSYLRMMGRAINGDRYFR